MKRFLFLILLLPVLASSQEVDSSKITQSITLTQLHHTYLVGFFTDMNSAARINYVKQLRAVYDVDSMAQNITVTAPSELILQVYLEMTNQREGVTSEYNNQIKEALMPQITNQWLVNELSAIIIRNLAIRDDKINKARELITGIENIP
jgi:hypothetical protein